MQDFRNLKIWQRAYKLTLQIYKYTNKFPKEELYGLTSQIRRASSSIAANIAEGCGKNSDADLARYLQIAMGSGSELEFHLMLASDLGFLTQEVFRLLFNELLEIKRMLSSFLKKLRANS